MRWATSRAPLGRWTALAAVGVVVAVASCGEVPTLDLGIAYTTPVELPLPAVAIGDTLRDSLGRAAPPRVRAFDRDDQEIPGIAVTFVPTTLPSLVDIDPASAFVVAHDTAAGSVQLVGRVGDRLQTPPVTLLVVPEPDRITRAAGDAAGDTAVALPSLRAFPVTVTGTRAGAIVPVAGIIVRYRIDSLFPAGAAGRVIFLNAAGATQRPDSTIAVDTTDASGNASRSVVVPADAGITRVVIRADARHLRDTTALQGSPVRIEVVARSP